MRPIRRSSTPTLCLIAILALAGLCNCAYGALANSAWPMFRHDLKHTALSQYPAPAPTGTPWKYYIGGTILSGCSFAPDGTVYTSGGTSLYALNSNGTLKWQISIGASTRSTPAVGSDGVVYIGSTDDKLYAINSNGTLKWSYNTGGDISSSPAIGTDGTIYVGSRSGYLYAMNANGTLKWRRTTGDAHMTSPAVGADGTIYIGGNALNAINPNGTVKWTYVAGGNFVASPAHGSTAAPSTLTSTASARPARRSGTSR